MALDTPTFISPIPVVETIESQFYHVSTQGLDTRPTVAGAMLGLKLLEYPPFHDPRITEPAIIGTIMYQTRITITKKYEVPGQAPWFFGTGLDANGVSRAGWFQKE